jgi:hypothetical protein
LKEWKCLFILRVRLENFKSTEEEELDHIKARAHPTLNCPVMSPNLIPDMILEHNRL